MTINKRHIMIVDDNEFVRGVLEEYLQSLDYVPIVCHETREAKEIFSIRKKQDLPLDLILMDVQMPPGFPSGLELGTDLYETYNFKDVVYISAYGTRKDVRERLKKIGSTYITKPFNNLAILENAIKKQLKLDT